MYLNLALSLLMICTQHARATSDPANAEERTLVEYLHSLRQQIAEAEQTLADRKEELHWLMRDFAVALQQVTSAHTYDCDFATYNVISGFEGTQRDYALNKLGALFMSNLYVLRQQLKFSQDFRPNFTISATIESAPSNGVFAIDFRRHRRLHIMLTLFAKTRSQNIQIPLGTHELTVDREGQLIHGHQAFVEAIISNPDLNNRLLRMQNEELTSPQVDTELAKFREFLNQKCRAAGIF